MASATGAIQFNKPEVAGDGKPARADPAPKPCISCTVRMPRKPWLHPPAYDQGLSRPRGRFLRRPAAPFPAWLAPHRPRAPKSRADTPTAGAGNAKPLLGRGHFPRARSSAPPRGSRTGASRPRGTPGERKPGCPPSARGDRRWRGGWREGTAGAGSAPRPGAAAPALASRGTVSGIPDPSGPGDEGPTPARLAPAAPAGRARSATALPSRPASASRRVSPDLAPREPGPPSAADKQSSKDTAAGAAGEGEGGETAAPPAPRRG